MTKMRTGALELERQCTSGSIYNQPKFNVSDK
ncbi:hypothetical protein CA54_58950 [Symmachiella macrocystis]|uniref:Uncharacterized protein n=1 Tax=Symmachiella macrocystis TaxID=2527985 RepID=A0A5C6B0B0_9PLAN|nr:hypothetical protein CA54_58950 [Symmachiella macrocystis]